jgi:aspartyl-tRNA(Asn)/glutamyl-tRNA(Gln) amidotransferase subunit C
MITPEEVKKLAQLARIDLSEAEQAGLQHDMESILGYVGELSQVEVPAGGESVSTALVDNVMRPDTDSYDPGIFTEDILAEAPARAGNFIKVKQILGGTDE